MVNVALINLIKDPTVPPINLLHLISYSKKYLDGLNFKIIDINISRDPVKECLSFRPDIVGISSLSFSYPQAIKFAREIKKVYNLFMIIGGVHISMAPYSFYPVFDIGVLGEGEETFRDILGSYLKERREGFKDIKGIIYSDREGNIVSTGERPILEDMDSIPLLDYSYLDESYFKKRRLFCLAGKKGREMSILTSRGCPYRCVFCATTRFWKKVRSFSPERITREIEFLYKNFRVDTIQIWDDLFIYSKDRIREVIEILDSKKLLGKIRFSCQGRINLIDDEICHLLKNLGVVTLSFGFESGSDEVLKYLKANSATIEDTKRTIKLCKKYGFKVFGSFIFASPTETLKDMEDSIKLLDFMRKSRVDKIWYFTATPFPGTALWDLAIANGYISMNNIDWKVCDMYNFTEPMFLDYTIKPEEFKKILNRVDKILWKINLPFQTRFIFSNIKALLSRFIKSNHKYLLLLSEALTVFGHRPKEVKLLNK